MQDAPIFLDTLIEAFGAFLCREAGLAPLTVEAYCREIRFMCKDLEHLLGRRPTVEDLIHDYLQGWLNWVQESVGPSCTQKRKAAAVRFCRYLLRRKIITVLPTTELLVPKLRPKLPRFLPADTAEALVAAPHQLASRRTQLQVDRDAALLEVLYEAALRVSEAGGLRMDGMLPESVGEGEDEILLIRVMGKGRKERLVPIRRAVPAIRRYLAHPRPAGAETVFLTLLDGRPLTGRAISSLVGEYASKMEIEAHAHLLRHTAATQMLLHGAELRAVQDFLGHADPRTTARYAHTTIEHLVRKGLNHHPFSRPGRVSRDADLDQVMAKLDRLEAQLRARDAPRRRRPERRPRPIAGTRAKRRAA